MKKTFSSQSLIVALSGAIVMAVAIGIGRFAFTPLLPMMLHDKLIDLKDGSLLATANYTGHLTGAFVCMVLPIILRRHGLKEPCNTLMIRYGLIATAFFTLAMALHLPALWVFFRFLAGLSSAVTFVYTSGWCLARLEQLGSASLGGIIYTGPGIGIIISGVAAIAISALHGSSRVTWLSFGILALLLITLVWPVFQPLAKIERPLAELTNVLLHPHEAWTIEQLLLAFAYGLAGFGYIITATFLPVIAREVLPGSPWVNFFWPIFGVSVVVGALLTKQFSMKIDRRLLLAGIYFVQALGVLAALGLPNITGFVVASLLVGLPFTMIVLFAMQEARRLRPFHPVSFIGLLAALYGIGQIVGPSMAGFCLCHTQTHAAGFAISLSIASGSLLFGSLLYLMMMAVYPLKK